MTVGAGYGSARAVDAFLEGCQNGESHKVNGTNMKRTGTVGRAIFTS
jgi:hypothetical protein